MKLKRRTLVAAAASSAAAIVTSARAIQPTSAPGLTDRVPTHPRPHEFDLADSASAEQSANRDESIFALLEELYPGDPGQLSGCALYISEGGRYTWLNAEIQCAPQRGGCPLSHCLGYLDAEDARVLVEQASDGIHFVAALRESYPQVRPGAFSGATLNFFGGDDPEIRLYVGSHCLGVLRGSLLAVFLDCARIRLALEVK